MTPVGLPRTGPCWSTPVADLDGVVVGSGLRRSKLLVPGGLLASLPGARVPEGLGVPVDG